MAAKRSRLRVRAARPQDVDALQRFACSTGLWFEDEVEDHIRNVALARAEAPTDDYRLLVFEEGWDLWAVGAHRLQWLQFSDDTYVATSHLAVLGLSLDYQGRSRSDGRRYSDLAMRWLIADALRHRGHGMLFALVARENVRSQRLCRRHGLTSETIAGPLRVRMTGRFAPARARRGSR